MLSLSFLHSISSPFLCTEKFSLLAAYPPNPQNSPSRPKNSLKECLRVQGIAIQFEALSWCYASAPLTLMEGPNIGNQKIVFWQVAGWDVVVAFVYRQGWACPTKLSSMAPLNSILLCVPFKTGVAWFWNPCSSCLLLIMLNPLTLLREVSTRHNPQNNNWFKRWCAQKSL